MTSFSIALPTSGIDDDVLKYTNQLRKSHKKSELTMRDELNKIARQHSADMAAGRQSFGHGGYDNRYEKIQKLMKYSCSMAENVAYGADTGKEAVEIWKKSSGHRKNMLGNYQYIGIGTARDKQGRVYYTQIFVR